MSPEWTKLAKSLVYYIDAHEVTKQRLLRYENEVGVPNNKGINDHRLGGGDEFYESVETFLAQLDK